MNKTAQNHTWNCLPTEVKKEVKRQYQIAINTKEYYTECTLEYLFGLHNLTSDAEGEEEMLTVPISKVQKLYSDYCTERDNEEKGSVNRFSLSARIAMLEDLFGSKCLPDEEKEAMTEERYQYLNSLSIEDYDNETSADEQRRFCEYQRKYHPDEVEWCQTHSDDKEPKPAEPKFKVGDKVKDISSPHDDGIYRVNDIKKSSDGFIYHIQGLIGQSNVKKSDLEPYKEPEENIAETRNLSHDRDKLFDNIIKDGFSKERRCNIAVQMVKALTQSSEIVDRISSGCDDGF